MAALEPPPALIASCIVLSLDYQEPRFKMLFPLFTVSCPCDPVWSWVYRWWPVVPIPALPYPHHLRIHGKHSRVLLSFFSLLHPLRSPFPFFTYFLFSHVTREGALVYVRHRVTSPFCALVYLQNGDFSYVAMEQVLELSGMEKDPEKHLPHGAWCSVSHV